MPVGPSCGAEISRDLLFGGKTGQKFGRTCICCNRTSQTEGAAPLKLTGDRLTGEMRGRSDRMRGGGGCERSRRGRKVEEERGELTARTFLTFEQTTYTGHRCPFFHLSILLPVSFFFFPFVFFLLCLCLTTTTPPHPTAPLSPEVHGWVRASCFLSSRSAPLVASRGIVALCVQLG